MLASKTENETAPRKATLPVSLAACLIALAIYGLADQFITKSLPNSYNHKQALLSSNKDASALVLGSSHALYGINAAELGKDAINLANTSQSIFIDEQLLKKYMETHRAPKVVIEPVSYFSLNYKLTKGPEE